MHRRKGRRQKQREERNSDTSVVYFTTLSVSQDVKHGMAELLVNKELKIIRKEVVVA
jgi:hypothetical protein